MNGEASVAVPASWWGQFMQSILSLFWTAADDTPVAIVKDRSFARVEDAMVGVYRWPVDPERRHDIRSQALLILDALSDGALDLSASSAIGPLVIFMRPDGWLALDAYSRARWGRGIHRVRFPRRLSNLSRNSTLRANMSLLRDLSTVQFGDVTVPLVLRAA